MLDQPGRGGGREPAPIETGFPPFFPAGRSAGESFARTSDVPSHPRAARGEIGEIMKRIVVLSLAIAVAIGGISAGLAIATPGSATVGAEFGRATLTSFHAGFVNRDIVVAENSFAPGGYSGWHSHPGKVLIGVQRGSITLYEGDDPGCSGTTYTAGQVAIEYPGVVYNGRNEGTVATILNVTYLGVPVGGSPRIDQPQPANCPF
jgi:quercetin dioxygenase-like cupin family protein